MDYLGADGDLIEHLSIMERFKRLLEKTDAKITDNKMMLRIMDAFCQGIRSQKDLIKNYMSFKSAILEEADYNYRKMSRQSHLMT